MLFLNDGNDIPQIGLAAFRIDSNEETKDIIRKSLASGVRHFEITELFGNGHTIVEGLFDSGLVQRKDVCISLKIWPKSRNSRDLIFACRSTLEFVGLDYVDIVMVHAPIEVNSRHDQWKAMEALVEEGLAKSLGISNITALQLAELLKSCNIPPAIFQAEVTPFNQKADVVELCEDNSIIVMSNEPLAKTIRNKHPAIATLSSLLNISVEELLLRWGVTKGFAVMLPSNHLTLSINHEALTNNEKLSDEVMVKMESLEMHLSTAWVPTEEDEHDG